MPKVFNVKDKYIVAEILRIKSLTTSHRVSYSIDDIKSQLAGFLEIEVSELETLDVDDFFSKKSYIEKGRINKTARAFYSQIGLDIHDLMLINRERRGDIKRAFKKGDGLSIETYVLGYPHLFNQPLFFDHDDVSNINKNAVTLIMHNFISRYKNELVLEAIENMLELSPEAYLSFLKDFNVPELKHLLGKLKNNYSEETKEEIKASYHYKILTLVHRYANNGDMLSVIDEVYSLIHQNED